MSYVTASETAVFALLAASLLSASGCASPRRVHTTIDAPVTTVRLTRADTSPLAGSFRQEGQAIVGQLAFSQDCAEETRQTTHRESRRTRVSAGWVATAVIGAAAAIGGVYALSRADGADRRVTCGNGYDAPKAGDKCESQASVLRGAGISLLVSGLSLGTTGGYMAAQTSYTERSSLPDQTSLVVRDARPCGSTAALEGLGVSVLLPRFGGKWFGRVDAAGTARIELGVTSPGPGRTVSVLVESVPAALAGVVKPGTLVGELVLNER